MIKIYDTLSKTKKTFVPIDSKVVKIYVCGPTVYKNIHIGNLRPLLVFDLFVKFLRRNFQVKYVRNITDVDDKIINSAIETNTNPLEITKTVTRDFHRICNILCLQQPDWEPKVTDHIDQIIRYIKTIESNGFAYELEDGLYFNTSKDPGYGRLASLDKNICGARIEHKETKTNKEDFVLWKKKNDYGFNSPWGYGRPGWHIECSAMSYEYLGDCFDIHGGGEDLRFPHHENEITQGIGFCNKVMSNYWMHNAMVMVEGKKMSKSLNNEVFVDELVQSSLDAAALRLVFFSTHYSHPLDFSFNLFEKSREQIVQWRIFRSINSQDFVELKTQSINFEYLSDDFNTAALVIDLNKRIKNFSHHSTVENFSEICHIMDFFGFGYIPEQLISPEETQSLIDKRNEYREKKDYTQADEIKKQLSSKRIMLFDKNNRTTWVSV